MALEETPGVQAQLDYIALLQVRRRGWGAPQNLGVRAGVCARLRFVLSHYARDLSLDVSWGHALHLAAAARASLEASLPIATHTLLWLEERF